MKNIVIALFLTLLLGHGNKSIAESLDVNLSDFRGRGGRVDWSPTNEFVVFDRKGEDGGFDLYITRDFKTEQCLTCNHPDLPNQKRNYGQPAVHPDGRYIVFQAEKQWHGFVVPLATNPGAGVFNDIWVYDLQTNRAKSLVKLPNSKHFGVLHPQFSKDGQQLSWSEMYRGTNLKFPGQIAGSWKLKVASFFPDGLSDIKEYQPAEEVIYENHGFSLDGKWLLFSSNMQLSNPVNLSTDIYKMNLDTGQLVRLTNEGYNEHAHVSPDGKYIVWMSSVGNGDTYDYYKVGTDYWIMNVDGSNKRRLTYLNHSGHPHFRGRYSTVADFAWDPSSSAEKGYRIFAYLHELVTKNFWIPVTDRAAKGEYNFMLEFSVGESDADTTDFILDNSSNVSLSDAIIGLQILTGRPTNTIPEPTVQDSRISLADITYILNANTNEHSTLPGFKPVIKQILQSTESNRDSVKSITLLRESGGRVDWSPDNETVLIDQKGDDGYYDIYQMLPDGSGEKCLTCDTGGVLSHGHNGQPVWHPSGDFFVFQSQKKHATGRWGKDLAAQPGFGRYCDLWLMYISTGELIQLTDTEDTDKTAVLHPHFSADGGKLAWSEMYSATNWRIMVADFALENSMPELSHVQMYEPGGPGLYEIYSFSPDNRKILFTSTFEAKSIMEFFKAANIYEYDLQSGKMVKLAEEKYNELPHLTPDGKRIVWMTSAENANNGTDYWLMNADGTGKRRITDFNNPRLSNYARKPVYAADFSFNHEYNTMIAFLQTNLLTQNGATFLIELDDHWDGVKE